MHSDLTSSACICGCVVNGVSATVATLVYYHLSIDSYARDWRYHKEERLWITRAPGMKPTKQESTYEEGTYCYFDVSGWRKAHKEFHVEYDKLEDRPQMPPNILGHQGLTPVPTQA